MDSKSVLFGTTLCQLVVEVYKWEEKLNTDNDPDFIRKRVSKSEYKDKIEI